MQFPDASMIRASLTTVAVAATMHHIKVPRGSTVSKVEVILSDTMSQERWSRDQRWMGGLWKWHRQHISCSPREYRSLRIRRFNGTSSSFGPSIFPPFPLRLDRTSRFQICVFRFLSFRCFLGVVLLCFSSLDFEAAAPCSFFRRLLQDGMFLLSSSRLHSGVVFPQILSSFFERQP